MFSSSLFYNHTQSFAATLLAKPAKGAHDTKPMGENAAAQEPSKNLEPHAGKRPSWATLGDMPTEILNMIVNELSDGNDLNSLALISRRFYYLYMARARKSAWISEIREIKTDREKFRGLSKFSKVTREIILECKRIQFGGADLIELISELREVFDFFPDVGSQVFAFEQLIKLAKKLPAEWWVAGVEMLMPSLEPIKVLYSKMEYAIKEKCYSRPLLDSFIMLIEMLETTHQDNKTLQASAAIVVVSHFNVIFDWDLHLDNFDCFSRAAQMFVHGEIDNDLKEKGFLDLLEGVKWVDVYDDEGKCIEEAELPLIHLQRASLDAIIDSMRNKDPIQKDLIQSLKEKRVEKFKDIYDYYGYEDK